jgi:Tol biopolymer transport system component
MVSFSLFRSLARWLRNLDASGRSPASDSQHRRFSRRPYIEPLEDRRLLSVDLVSIGLSGVSGNNTSESACVSADGRYVAFESIASDLVPGDSGYTDVFVRDLVAGTTVRASTDSQGNQADYWSGTPSISGDGRYVAFASLASNLVAGDTNSASDVFVKDLLTGITTRVSTNELGNQVSGSSDAPSISSDGRYVAFEGVADNLVSGDTNGKIDIFVKDMATGITTCVSTDSQGNVGNSGSFASNISNDGRYVGFQSYATNLVPGDTNGVVDAFVKDLVSGTTTRVSTDSEGNQADSASSEPHLSSDGRYAVFGSVAALVADDTSGHPDVFLKDLWTGTTTRVSTDSEGNQVLRAASGADLSGDGRYVTFVSDADNLVPGDTNLEADIFVKDLATGVTLRVNVSDSGYQADEMSWNASISSDGHYIVFSSDSTNLHPADTTDNHDVYRVWNPLFAPEIALYGSTIAENQPAGTAVGAFATGANPSGPFTYSLVTGDGDTDNAAFTIEGSTLKTAATFDFETRSSYSIRVESTDGASVTCEQTFTITVADVHDFASPALYDPATSTFYLRTANTSGQADYTFGYGEANGGWTTLVGDWNGDDQAGVGLYDPATSTFYLTNAYESGYAQCTFGYGEPGAGWIPLVGDWDGNGTAGVGLYDPHASTFYLTNTLQSGIAEYTFGYGEPNAGWTPLVGDWNGDGRTGVGLYNPHASTFYLTNSFQTGYAELTFGYGEPAGGWTPLVGDWDGDHADGVGLFNPHASTFYLTNAFTSGYAQYTFGYGEPGAGWTPLVGDWNGNGACGVGLYAPTSSTFYLTDTLSSGYAEYTVGFGQPGGGWQPLVGCWTTEGSQGQTTSVSAQAVDQLDLAALAARQLAPAVSLADLGV